MKTIFRKLIPVLLLPVFAWSLGSVGGFHAMSPPSVQEERAEAAPAADPAPRPAPRPSAEPEDPAEPSAAPVPAPKPAYTFPEDFAVQLLPADWFAECPSPGRVETVEYPAADYRTGKAIVKKMDVYLPAGYDPSRPYDVLILTHGAGDDECYWFSEEHEYGGQKVNAKVLADNMIFRGLCRPLLIASVTCTNEVSCSGKAYNWDQLVTDGAQFSRELSGDILPFLVRNYSTFASSPDSAALSQARDHFAYFGLSWSAMFGYRSILPEDMAYFAWFALIAPSRVNLSGTLGAIAESAEAYPVRALYAGVGAKDQVLAESEAMYADLIGCGAFTDGGNAYQVITENVSHHFESWCTSLYNCLLLFF